MKTNWLMTLMGSVLLAEAPLIAQPTAFTYQGRLSDLSGPASGIYDFQFVIYDAVTNGSAAAGPLTRPAATVSNGLFTVALDFGANVFTGAARWLEIGVRTNGSTKDYDLLSPRQLLAATPYAVRAANFSGPVAASQLTGTISSNNIGAGSITTVMLAAGAVGSNQLSAGAVTTAALADGSVTAPKVATVSNWFSLTIANPTPLSLDYFGNAVAAVGSDRVLIGAYLDGAGAPSAGAVYLFNTNGTLLTTFTNPTPATEDLFGWSVAAVGSDRVLIGADRDDTGAEDAGAAYLFNTSGTLLMTLTNPTPALRDSFGYTVAAVGSDLVLIGAHGDNTGAPDAGAAYLFTTNGALLTTFTHPTPAASELFGISVAAVGSDRVLIGASRDDRGAPDAGAAYLFSTNGTLLTTLTNPTPAANDLFGISVAAVGSDRLLVGAYQDDMGAANAGAAYLFSINGTLLTTFANPTPVADDFFGRSVAAVGTDRMLIGAFGNNTGASFAGAAYLFNTDGTLLTTFTSPTPAAYEFFGHSLAAMGSDRVVISASGDNTGAPGAGAVYLFSTGTFTPGLVAEGVRPGAITTLNLQDGAVTATKIGGVLNESHIPELNASKLTSGTLTDARLSSNVALLNSNNSFTGTNALNDRDLRLRWTWDHHHGLGWYGTAGPDKRFAGVDVDGPVLYGYSGGALGSTLGEQRIALRWDAQGNVAIGTNSPQSVLHVSGNGPTDSGAILGVQTSGSINGAAVYGRSLVGGGNAIVGEANVVGPPGSFPVGVIGTSSATNGVGVYGRASGTNGLAGLFQGRVSLGSGNGDTKLAVWDGGGTALGLGIGPGQFRLHLGHAGNRFSFLDAPAGNEIMTIQGKGNVGIGTNDPQEAMHVMGSILATGTITPNSDRNAKTNIVPVNTVAILERVAKLPLQQWRFKTEAADVKHVGPMAQDFHAAFGLGAHETAIATVDADGVALAAIQGLNQKFEEQLAKKNDEIQALKTSLAELKELVSQLAGQQNGGVK